MVRMKIFRIYMLCVGVLGQSISVVQAFKIFSTQSAHNLSLLAFSFGLIAACSWFVYGVVIKDAPIIVSNMVGIWGGVAAIAGIVLYG